MNKQACASCGAALHVSHEEIDYLVDESNSARCPVASAALGPEGFAPHSKS